MTKEQVLATLDVITAVLDVIEAHGPNGVPSGELYVRLEGKLSLQSYESIIDLLVRANRVKRTNHLLTAVRRQATVPGVH